MYRHVRIAAQVYNRRQMRWKFHLYRQRGGVNQEILIQRQIAAGMRRLVEKKKRSSNRQRQDGLTDR